MRIYVKNKIILLEITIIMVQNFKNNKISRDFKIIISYTYIFYNIIIYILLKKF